MSLENRRVERVVREFRAIEIPLGVFDPESRSNVDAAIGRIPAMHKKELLELEGDATERRLASRYPGYLLPINF